MNTPCPIVRSECKRQSRPWTVAAIGLLVCAVCIAAPNGLFSQETGAANGNSTVEVAIDVPQVDTPRVELSQGQPTETSGSVEPEDLNTTLAKRGSITLRESSLADWLFAIKQEWGVNFVYSNKELKSETVEGVFENRPLREILDVILLSKGYGYQKVGNTLMIRKAAEIDLTSQFEDVLIPLEFIDSKEVAESVQIFLSPGGEVQPYPTAKSIYVRDLPTTLAKVRRHLTSLEDAARANFEREQARRRQAEEETRARAQEIGTGPESSVEIDNEVVGVFRLRFVEAATMLDALGIILGAEGRITVMTEENKIVVMAPQSTMDGVEQIVERLDVPRPQVRITALLYDVNVEAMERLGFNWSNIGRGRLNASGDPQSLFELNSTNFNDATTAPPPPDEGGDGGAAVVTNPIGALVRMRHLSRYFDLNTILQAFQELEGARLLARPNVVAYDGVEALFRSVSEIPVQQLTQTSEGGSIGTTEFREAGITLTVTPRINDDGSLRLSIVPEFSVLAGFQDGQPIIDRRMARTSVHLYDGETVVIGGLLRRNELETQTGVPGLNRLKYLKPFFKYHETTVAESELLVFIRAEVIGPEPVMSPRNHMAQTVLNEKLEQIPVAAHHPVVPHCGDPYCPYHCPPPLWLDGMLYKADGFGEPEELPPTEFEQGGSTLPTPPPPRDAATHEPMRNFATPEVGPRAAHPAINSSIPGIGAEPPPVTIDSAARIPRPPRRNYAIRRLPHISQETDPRQLAPVAAPYIPDRRVQQPSLRLLPGDARQRQPSPQQPPTRTPRSRGGILQNFIR